VKTRRFSGVEKTDLQKRQSCHIAGQRRRILLKSGTRLDEDNINPLLRSFAGNWRRLEFEQHGCSTRFSVEMHVTSNRMSCYMINRKGYDLSPRIKARYLALHPTTIERIFADCVMDLKEDIVLDGIEILPDNCGFRVRSHDLYGPLPDIRIKDSGDTFQDKDRLSKAACKLVAIVRLRME